jgi:hypothetical protein
MLIFIWIFFYILPVILVLFNDDIELTLSGKLFALIPLVAWFHLIVILVKWIKDNWKDNVLDVLHRPIIYYNLKKCEREEKANRLRIALEERERKIQNGIIRISPIDPYGEEDWAPEDIIPKYPTKPRDRFIV